LVLGYLGHLARILCLELRTGSGLCGKASICPSNAIPSEGVTNYVVRFLFPRVNAWKLCVLRKRGTVRDF